MTDITWIAIVTATAVASLVGSFWGARAGILSLSYRIEFREIAYVTNDVGERRTEKIKL